MKLQRRSQELLQQILSLEDTHYVSASSKETLFEFQNLIIYIYHIIIIINLYLSISCDDHFSSVENNDNEEVNHVNEDQHDHNHQYHHNNDNNNKNKNYNKSNNNNYYSTNTVKSNKLSTNINKLSTHHIKNYIITENHHHHQHQQQQQQDHHQFMYLNIYPLIHQLLTIMINTIIIPMISLSLSSPYLCSFHDYSVTVYQMRLTLYTFEDNLIILHKFNHYDQHHQQHNHHHQQQQHQQDQHPYHNLQQDQQYKQLNPRIISTHHKSKNRIDSNDKNLHILDFDDDNDDYDNKKHSTTSDIYSVNYDDSKDDNSINILSSFQQLVKLLSILDDQINQYIQGSLTAVIDFYEGTNDYYYYYHHYHHH